MFDWRENYLSICNAPLVTIEHTDLDARHPAVEFRRYWQSLNKGETPNRSSFNPQDIPTLLRWLMMFRREMKDGHDRYFLYIQGNSAAELTDGLLQGQYLDEFTEQECFDTRREVLRGVLQTGQPAYANIEVGVKKADFIANIGVGAFPFYQEDQEPEVVMVPAPIALELRRYL